VATSEEQAVKTHELTLLAEMQIDASSFASVTRDFEVEVTARDEVKEETSESRAPADLYFVIKLTSLEMEWT